MADTKAHVERPLSPHMTIYRWPLPMAMSIAHRITGAGLYFGTLLVAWWLIAAAAGPNPYSNFAAFMSSFFGRLILFGYTFALLHHMLGGLRHLIWDTGRGFSQSEREWLSLATLVGSLLWCSVLAWLGTTVGRHPELLAGSLHRFFALVLGVAALLALLYYLFVRRAAAR